jgi:hypothetical protein
MVTAVVLQFVDTAPLRADADVFLAGRDKFPAPFAMPPGATLPTTVPVCSVASDRMGSTLRLAAVRAGILLSDIAFARLPE